MELVRPLAERNRVRMEYEGAQQLLAPIDVHRVTQVFVNLMLNAVQAMPKGGVLCIDCRAVPASNGEPGWAEVTSRTPEPCRILDRAAAVNPADRPQPTANASEDLLRQTTRSARRRRPQTRQP